MFSKGEKNSDNRLSKPLRLIPDWSLLMKFFIFKSVYISPATLAGCQDLAPFPLILLRGGLLALQRACLSALLYKSMKQMCLFDFDTTNVEPANNVSKRAAKFFYNAKTDDC